MPYVELSMATGEGHEDVPLSASDQDSCPANQRIVRGGCQQTCFFRNSRESKGDGEG